MHIINIEKYQNLLMIPYIKGIQNAFLVKKLYELMDVCLLRTIDSTKEKFSCIFVEKLSEEYRN